MTIPSVFIIPKEEGVTFTFHLITVTQTHERASFLSCALKDLSRQEQRLWRQIRPEYTNTN